MCACEFAHVCVCVCRYVGVCLCRYVGVCMCRYVGVISPSAGPTHVAAIAVGQREADNLFGVPVTTYSGFRCTCRQSEQRATCTSTTGDVTMLQRVGNVRVESSPSVVVVVSSTPAVDVGANTFQSTSARSATATANCRRAESVVDLLKMISPPLASSAANVVESNSRRLPSDENRTSVVQVPPPPTVARSSETTGIFPAPASNTKRVVTSPGVRQPLTFYGGTPTRSCVIASNSLSAAQRDQLKNDDVIASCHPRTGATSADGATKPAGSGYLETCRACRDERHVSDSSPTSVYFHHECRRADVGAPTCCDDECCRCPADPTRCGCGPQLPPPPSHPAIRPADGDIATDGSVYFNYLKYAAPTAATATSGGGSLLYPRLHRHDLVTVNPRYATTAGSRNAASAATTTTATTGNETYGMSSKLVSAALGASGGRRSTNGGSYATLCNKTPLGGTGSTTTGAVTDRNRRKQRFGGGRWTKIRGCWTALQSSSSASAASAATISSYEKSAIAAGRKKKKTFGAPASTAAAFETSAADEESGASRTKSSSFDETTSFKSKAAFFGSGGGIGGGSSRSQLRRNRARLPWRNRRLLCVAAILVGLFIVTAGFLLGTVLLWPARRRPGKKEALFDERHKWTYHAVTANHQLVVGINRL